MSSIKLLEELRSRIDEIILRKSTLKIKQQEVDSAITDLYHIMESQKLDAVGITRMGINLQKLVKKRRDIKTELNLLNSASDRLQLSQSKANIIKKVIGDRKERDKNIIAEAAQNLVGFEDRVNKIIEDNNV